MPGLDVSGVPEAPMYGRFPRATIRDNVDGL